MTKLEKMAEEYAEALDHSNKPLDTAWIFMEGFRAAREMAGKEVEKWNLDINDGRNYRDVIKQLGEGEDE